MADTHAGHGGHTGAHFVPATRAQRRAQALYARSDVLVLLGPAGSGKTHTALALALADVLGPGPRRKVILSRPLVSCGEELGFLPGEVGEKLGPWHGAFLDVVPSITFAKPEVLLSQGTVELWPLGLMRGRTVARAVGILDEAQNCTMAQIRLFLSRLGQQGKLIVCGDPSQADVAGRALARTARALRNLPGVGVVRIPETDCVRHPLIPAMLDRLSGL